MDRQQIEKTRDLLQEANDFLISLGLPKSYGMIENSLKVCEALEILEFELML